MPGREDKPTDEELFRQAMQDVEPLRAPARSNSKAPRKSDRPSSRVAQPTPQRAPGRKASPGGASDNHGSHRKHGVQVRTLQKLKRGRFPPADTIDLHHLTVARGLAVLQEFLDQSRTDGLQCVRVIHGKGLRSQNGPRLKQAVHRALRDDPGVLAFTICKPADGGSGAVDVLLKSS
ncbi:MAG: Smr/MutS family protein [Lysobacterales bacterium]|jgi:DNA-nicking Smr family endonuclease